MVSALEHSRTRSSTFQKAVGGPQGGAAAADVVLAPPREVRPCRSRGIASPCPSRGGIPGGMSSYGAASTMVSVPRGNGGRTAASADGQCSPSRRTTLARWPAEERLTHSYCPPVKSLTGTLHSTGGVGSNDLH